MFRKIIILLPPLKGRVLAQNHVFAPIFRLHTVTTGTGDLVYGYFLRVLNLLIEIYQLVPSTFSTRKGLRLHADPAPRTGLRVTAPQAQYQGVLCRR